MPERLLQQNERDPAAVFKTQLHAILYTPVTVENISRFADDALEQLITLNEGVVSQYQRECAEADQYTGTELEDQAYAHYGLENLNDALERITVVRDQIASIAAQVSEELEHSSTIMTPPDPTSQTLTETGSGTYEAPKRLNRLITLAYILEHDFSIDHSAIRYVQGSTTDTMLRQEPYMRVEVKDLNRIVYVCDEEGNASYVFDSEVLDQLGITLVQLDHMTKNQRNALLRITPTAGQRIIQTPEWRSVMTAALQEPFAETKVIQPKVHSPVSEFAERSRFLEFDKFVAGVRKAYEEAGSPGGISKWYRDEHKKQRGWPALPEKTYLDKGWKSYPELVGKEVVEFLKFSDFVTAVRKAYGEAGSPGGINKWYRDEHKKQRGWPAVPAQSYKGQGWKSYRELVGKEVVEFLEFTDFVTAVRALYKKAGSPGNKEQWYSEEYKNQNGWPAVPAQTYKNKGWMEGTPKLRHLF